MSYEVPEAELVYRASRGGGPGGQHVNKAATRVEVAWDVRASPSLTEEQREILLDRLRNRVSEAGVLRIVAGTRRSLERNRRDATARLQRLVADALAPRKPRLPTRVPRAARDARLDRKRKRSDIKKSRRRVEPED